MKTSFTAIFRLTYLSLSFTLAAAAVNAQLKVGDNPTSIQKSSILELESTRQVCCCQGLQILPLSIS